jgi:hypothetical protein
MATRTHALDDGDADLGPHRTGEPSQESLRTDAARTTADAIGDEHARLQKRTDALKTQHAGLSRAVRPFNQREHDRHKADLAEHKRNLGRHRTRTVKGHANGAADGTQLK